MSLPGRRALMGEEPEAMLVRFRERGGQESRWARIKAKPVHEDDGSVRLAINVIEDVTEAKRDEQARALPRRGRASSRRLARLRDDARHRSPPSRSRVFADWCVR